MTGAWGEGNATPAAEFNALNDPEALAMLLDTGRPVVLAGARPDAPGAGDACTASPPWRRLGGGRCLQAACDIQAAVPPSARDCAARARRCTIPAPSPG